MDNNVTIIHPGVQHSYQTAFAVQKANRLRHYYTSLYYKDEKSIFKALSKFKGLHTKFRNKRFYRGLDQSKVKIFPWFEIFERSYYKLTRSNQKSTPWTDKRFDKYVASKRITCKDHYVIAFPTAAFYTFKKVKSLGNYTILDMPSVHHHFIRRMLEDEELLSPEFKESLQYNFPANFNETMNKEISLADFIVVPSDFVKHSLVAEGVPSEKVHKIPYGCNFQPIPETDITTYSLGEELRVVFVGQIQQKKGIKYLLEAARILISRGLKIKVSLVGKIYHCEDALKEFSSFYEHVPFMDHTSLKGFVQKQHVLISPSLFEGSSLAVMEGLSSGLACIVTKNCGAESVNETNGFTIPIRDSLSIAEKIDYLYHNPHVLNKMKIAAVRSAKLCSWNNYYNNWAHFLSTSLVK